MLRILTRYTTAHTNAIVLSDVISCRCVLGSDVSVDVADGEVVEGGLRDDDDRAGDGSWGVVREHRLYYVYKCERMQPHNL